MQDKKIAFVFPGQGSQAVGMLSTLADEPIVRETLKEADEALGFALSKLIAEGPTEELSLTVNTQPALVCASIAMYRFYLQEGGRKPDLLAGHSLGEYSALVAAGALDFTDALQLVRYRAEQMQAAVPVGEGTMAAILGLSDDQVKTVCLECATNGVVEAVNFNTPGQVVIAGTVAAVQEAMEKSLAAGAKRAIKLNVSGPFHSSLMKPAAFAMEEKLKTVDLQKPFLSYITLTSKSTKNPTSFATFWRLRLPLRFCGPIQFVRWKRPASWKFMKSVPEQPCPQWSSASPKELLLKH